MNAPAQIDHPKRATGPAWERYLPSVEALAPGGSDDEKRHRAGIMLLRDLAAVGRRDACAESEAVLALIQRIATTHCISALSEGDLDTARIALIRLYTGARDLEKVFGANGK